VLSFRPLTRADLPRLHAWLNEPHVAPWWFDDAHPTIGQVEAKYGPRLAPDTKSEQWLSQVDGDPVGWIQCYALVDWPETAADYGIDDPTVAGVDLLIGDPARIGGGLGPALLRGFAAHVVFGMHPAWTAACAAPHRDNRRSWRAFEKAGFSYLRDVVDGGHPGRLYRLARSDVQTPPPPST
jgi:aminoglycoside 6'-N-acetyltransferase